MTKRTSKKEEGNKFLPSRKDYNYTTVIDRFEKYAFTYYFAYELAARNNYVAESLIFLKDLFDLYLVLDEINRSSSLTVTNIEKAVEKIFTTEEIEILKSIPTTSIIKGDSKYLSIAAASVLAKTYRDEYMDKIHEEFPMYNWKKNKGYPTKDHREAIKKYGPCKYHRMSFRLLPEQLSLEF